MRNDEDNLMRKIALQMSRELNARQPVPEFGDGDAALLSAVCSLDAAAARYVATLAEPLRPFDRHGGKVWELLRDAGGAEFTAAMEDLAPRVASLGKLPGVRVQSVVRLLHEAPGYLDSLRQAALEADAAPGSATSTPDDADL